MKSGDLIKMLEENGWQLIRIKGSHHQFKHSENPLLLTVAHPEKDMPIGTVASILRKAGLK